MTKFDFEAIHNRSTYYYESYVSNILMPAVYFREAGEYTEALLWLEEWLCSDQAQRSGVAAQADAWALCSHIKLLQGRIYESIKYLEKAESLSPNNVSVIINRARLYLKKQDNTAALRLAQSILRRFPSDPSVSVIMASALGAMGCYSEALLKVNNTIQYFPDHSESLATRSLIQARTKEFDKAKLDALRALLIKPYAHQLWSLLSRLFLQSGVLSTAITMQKRAVIGAPKQLDYLITLSDFLSSANKIDDSYKMMKHTIRLFPFSDIAWINLSKVQCKKMVLDNAVKSSRRAIMLRPDMASHYVFYANILKMIKEWCKSLDAINRAYNIEANNISILLNKANILLRVRCIYEALQTYEQVLRLSPIQVDALLGAGNALSELGRLEEALQAYD
ncbi:tetratricopeptide repeat protein, partial [Thalassobaculum litoreum]